jgi:hypothetical protein
MIVVTGRIVRLFWVTAITGERVALTREMTLIERIALCQS